LVKGRKNRETAPLQVQGIEGIEKIRREKGEGGREKETRVQGPRGTLGTYLGV